MESSTPFAKQDEFSLGAVMFGVSKDGNAVATGALGAAAPEVPAHVQPEDEPVDRLEPLLALARWSSGPRGLVS